MLGKIMGELLDPLASLRDYLKAEKADSTRRAYGSDFADFTQWCEGAGLCKLPAEPLTVARYLAALADRRLKASSIRRHCAAISYFHRMAGHPTPTLAHGVSAVMKGIRRTIGTAPNRKAPVTAVAITEMTKGLPNDLPGMRDRALLLIGFAAALRRSELVALDVADIERAHDGIRITLRRSKVDQAGEGYTIAIPRGSRLKPVQALEKWLEAAKITEGAVFRSFQKGGRLQTKRLTGKSVATIVKRHAAKAGLDPAIYSGHSLRTGFVTSALEHGVDVLRVMDITRHRDTKMLKVYDRRARGFKDHPGRDFL